MGWGHRNPGAERRGQCDFIVAVICGVGETSGVGEKAGTSKAAKAVGGGESEVSPIGLSVDDIVDAALLETVAEGCKILYVDVTSRPP